MFLWAVDDTLCRKRGLTLYGAGMHYDPLISSRSKALVSWGHDWVVLCLIIVHPLWAPTKVFALPIAARLYINRQGLTKGKKGKGKSSRGRIKAKAQPEPDHRTRPELALELILLAARWFPDDEIIMLGDRLMVVKAFCSPPRQCPSHQPGQGQGRALRRRPAAARGSGRPTRKKGHRLPGMAEWAADPEKPWTPLGFHQFGLHAALEVKTIGPCTTSRVTTGS